MIDKWGEHKGKRYYQRYRAVKNRYAKMRAEGMTDLEINRILISRRTALKPLSIEDRKQKHISQSVNQVLKKAGIIEEHVQVEAPVESYVPKQPKVSQDIF